ncbi:MAG: CDC48 family AAA ATPase [Halobacteriota archaeon]
MTEEVTLKVVEAYHRDAGRGIARIDMDTMRQLGLVSGDIIEITGHNRAAAIVWPAYPEDRGLGIIRIDGNIRGNAHVGIDDKVVIRKAKSNAAAKITLAPTQPVRIVGGEEYLMRFLEGRPVQKGEMLRVEMLGNPITFVITATQPAGIVIAGKSTQITLKEKPTVVAERSISHVTYEDIGGLKRELGMVREMIELPLRHPEIFQKLGIDPPKGVLLYGPPGTGKTLIAKAVANETDAYFINISGPEIMSKFYGESEQHLRELFKEGSDNAPAIIFIDEIDAIAPKRSEVTGEVERRVVAQLLALMDGLEARGQVVVIAATNRPEGIDPALRRPGRFDREIEIGVPDAAGRLQILQVHTRGMPIADDVKLEDIARTTHGFVGADLAAVSKEAAMHALRRLLPEIDLEREIPQEVLDKLQVNEGDFENVQKNIEPSAMREVFVEAPNVKWQDVGGLEAAKQELIEAVEWPIKFANAFSSINTRPPKGVLLFGPPGTGKTLLAQAVATESEANFISIKGPELLSKWVGESEKGVRETFRRAKQVSPTIILFDELDAVAPTRGASSDSHVTERVVSQLLTELDGLEALKDVVVIGATNRPDMVDVALLRPGRLDRLVYIPPPNASSRAQIFAIHLLGKPLAEDVDIEQLAKETEGYVGADIEAICREAAMLALRDFIKPEMTPEQVNEGAATIKINKGHLYAAINRVKPTASRDMLHQYENIAKEFAKFSVTEEEVKEQAATPETGYA